MKKLFAYREKGGKIMSYHMGPFQEIVLRYHLRKILGSEDVKNYCLLHWISLKERMPEDGSYVLIKYLDTDGRTVCSGPACYEGKQFRDLFTDDLSLVINQAIILGWTYYPYDDRLPLIMP